MESTPSPVEPVAVPNTPVSIGRPRSVTLLALGVLIITVINLIRFALSLREWSFLAARASVSPLYLALSGLVWTVAGACLVWGLWSGKRWAPRYTQAVALTYALYYWLDLLFLQDHPTGGAGGLLSKVLPNNWLFSVLVTILFLAYIAWTLGRRKVKAFFNQDRANAPGEPAGGMPE